MNGLIIIQTTNKYIIEHNLTINNCSNVLKPSYLGPEFTIPKVVPSQAAVDSCSWEVQSDGTHLDGRHAFGWGGSPLHIQGAWAVHWCRVKWPLFLPGNVVSMGTQVLCGVQTARSNSDSGSVQCDRHDGDQSSPGYEYPLPHRCAHLYILRTVIHMCM